MISVVVPTLDEASNLARLLGELAREQTPHEVVVVDGGSTDGTADQALAGGARLIHSARGRGRQLADGAAAAEGDPLLFLHADSRFPPGGLAAIRHTLAGDPAPGGGNFRLIFDGDDGFSRRLTRFYAWLRRHNLYYGDSGIFLRREVYDQIGGIRPIALMEDYDLVLRLQRHGPTACIEDPPLVTSSRRFRERHPARIVAGWLAMHALFHLKVPPDRLARWYYGRPVPRV